jgi:hypothetical protein
MQQKEIKKILKNNNFRNNQNYIIWKSLISKSIKYIKSYKFEKLEDWYFWEKNVELIIEWKNSKFLKHFIISFFIILFSIFLPFILIYGSIYFLYLVSYYFGKEKNFKYYFVVKDNKRILFSQMWYYKSKIKLGITKVYYKHY